MWNENIRECETSSNLDDQRADDGNEQQQQQISIIDDTNQQAIVPAIMETLQNRIAIGNLASTPGTINVSLNLGIGTMKYQQVQQVQQKVEVKDQRNFTNEPVVYQNCTLDGNIKHPNQQSSSAQSNMTETEANYVNLPSKRRRNECLSTSEQYNVAESNINNPNRPPTSVQHNAAEVTNISDSSKLHELQKKLLHTAKLISGEKSSLGINKDVQTVELQLSKSGSNRIEESDYFKRKRDPKLWNQARQGDIKLEDLFKQAEELAREQAEKETSNDEAKKKFVSIHGNCVGISGQAGIGKTTLTKQLAEKVLNKNMLDIDYLFYVSLKTVNYEEKMSVLQFLLTNLDSSWENDSTSDKEILKLLEESEKVMMIFDGLDEATIELKTQCPNKLYDKSSKPELILKHILNGNILRKAKKLITSRPRQMWELRKEYRPRCIVDVLGINSQAQREICVNICGDDCEKVLDELWNHPELVAQCYVPIICIFTIYWLYQKQHHPDKTVDFASVTNIILNVLETFATHDIARIEFELEKLSKLAWEGLRCKKYEFTEVEIKKSELKKENLNTVLVTNLRIYILHVEKITYFSHLILQEFFSAICLILYLPFSDFKEVLGASDERFGNLDVVKNFIFGLCNANTYNRLINLPSTSFPDNSDFDRKKLFLEKFVRKIVKDLSSNDFSKFLEICSWLYEIQDQKLSKKVVQRFPSLLKISYRNIFPHDVGSLFYVLQERKKLLELEINNPTFVGDSRERFLKKLAVTSESIKIKLLRLYESPLNDETIRLISSCIDQIEELDFSAGDVTVQGWEILSTAMNNRPTPMTRLALFGSPLNNEGLAEIASCVDTVETLALMIGDVTTHGWKTFSTSINNRATPLTKLQLRGSPLNDEGIVGIASCVDKIDELEIRAGDDTSHGWESLSTAINNRSTPIRMLWFGASRLNTKAIAGIASCVNKIEELSFNAGDVTKHGWEILSSAVNNRPTPMRKLWFDDTPLNGEAIVGMASCVNKIEELEFHAGNVTIHDWEILSTAIKKRSTRMEHLLIFNCSEDIKNKVEELLRGCRKKLKDFNLL